jgi:hypothetical protein
VSGEVDFSEFQFRSGVQAELRERAEKAEAALETAKGIMTTLSQEGAKTEVELANLRAAAQEVLRALLAERQESTLARSIVSEHALVRLAALTGTEWP